MSCCPGLKPLFNALKEAFSNEKQDTFEAVVQSFMNLFVRMWERVSVVLMDYVEMSDEKPSCDVNRIW